MSNVNNYEFAKYLDSFKSKILDPQIKKVENAKAIMADPNHKWTDDKQKNAGAAQLEAYKAWLQYYSEFYQRGLDMCKQHENMVNLLAKWYANWYDNISNEGRQETEMMSIQADMLLDIFVEIYKELLPLKLDIKPPKPMNL